MVKLPKAEFLIDTEVLLDHLQCESDDASFLEQLMTRGLCFTTVLNTAELLYRIPQKSIVLDLLNAIKVLGIHPKYSVNVDKYRELKNPSAALFCALAEINKLPVATLNGTRYITTGLKTVVPEDIK